MDQAGYPITLFFNRELGLDPESPPTLLPHHLKRTSITTTVTKVLPAATRRAFNRSTNLRPRSVLISHSLALWDLYEEVAYDSVAVRATIYIGMTASQTRMKDVGVVGI